MKQIFACAAMVLFSLLGPLTSASGQTIDRRLRIQPIQVCSDDGTDCANTNRILFSAETTKIWAQAGVEIEMLPWEQFYGTPWLNLTTSIFDDYTIYGLAGSPGHGQNPDPTVINVWFVKSFNNGAFGHSLQTSPGIAQRNGVGIADNSFSYNNGIGRRDVLAHELGHNLGLDHTTLGAIGNTNLMVPGRQTPDSTQDIIPDGQQLDFLGDLQIAQARSTSFLIPLDARLQIQASNGCVVLSWEASGFTLESALSSGGPWQSFPAQTSPQVVPCTNQYRLFRLKH